jgi:hypothetical protein
MDSIYIKIKDKETYQHLMLFLKKFSKKELQIMEAKDSFKSVQNELRKDLKEMDSGSMNMMELEEFDKELEDIIAHYEN